jgi:Cadherin-like
VTQGHIISATLTRAATNTFASFYGTSEFSNSVVLQSILIAPPQFQNGTGSITVEENAAPSYVDFKLLLEDPSAIGVTFSLDPTGDDNSYFGLDQTSGVLTISPTNYEALLNDPSGPRDHHRSITVIATDGVGSTSMTYVIYFDDVNEGIQLSAPISAVAIEDTAFQFTNANAITLTDPDEGTTPSTILGAPATAITPVDFAITATLADGTPVGSFSFNGLPLSISTKLILTDLITSLQIIGNLNDVNQALAYLEYTPTLNSNASVTINYSVSDQGSGVTLGGVNTSSKTTTLTVTPIDDLTVLSLPTSLTIISLGDIYQLGNPLAPTLLISDVDSVNTPMQMVVSVGRGSLSVPLFPGITSLTVTPNGPQLILEGVIADLQKALNLIQFTAAPGSQGLVPITVSIFDPIAVGPGPLSIVTDAFNLYVSSPPSISDGDYNLTVIEGTPTPTQIFAQATLGDYDASDLVGLRFRYPAALLPDESFLQPPASGAITLQTVDAANGILTFAGSASIADYQAFIRQFSYLNVATNPSLQARAFSIEVSDGTHWSNLATTNIFVTPVNSKPTISAPTNLQVVFAQEIRIADQALSTPFSISDADAGASFLEFNASVNSGLLRFDNQQNLATLGNISGSNTLKIIGTLAQLNIAIGQLYYKTNLGFEGSDLLSISIDDFGGNNLPAGLSLGTASSTIQALAGTPPTGTIGSENIVFSENNGPVFVLPSIFIGGTNTGNIESAIVTIAGGYDPAYDRLIGVGVWNSTTGQLSVSGPLSIEDFQKRLQQIKFENTSDTPATGKREILVELFDGLQHSAVESMFLEVVATNDAPTLSVIPLMTTLEDKALNFSNIKFPEVEDVDSVELVLQIQASNGSFSWVGTGVKPNTIDLLSNGLVTLTGSALDINAWATQLAFVPDANFNGIADIKWVLNDGELTPLSITRQSSVTVAAVNDSPTWLSNASINLQQSQQVSITSSNAKVSDVEDSADYLTYVFVSMPQHGQIMLNGRALSMGDSFKQSDIDAGLLNYKHGAGTATSDAVSFEVFDRQGASTGVKALSISIALTPVVVVTPPSSGGAGVRDNTAGVSGTGGTGDTPSTSVKGIGAVDGNASSESGGATSSVLNVAISAQKLQPSANKATTGSSSFSAPSAAAFISGNSNGIVATTSTSQVIAFSSEKFGTTSVAKDNATTKQDSSSSSQHLRTRTDVENTQYTGIIRAALTDKSFYNEVQKNRDESNKAVKFDQNIVASTTVVSASLSIGYVIWLVRGGALMSSLLASVPAWRLMDPLPILGSMGDGENDDEDDESLDAMIESARAKKTLAQNNPLTPATTT